MQTFCLSADEQRLLLGILENCLNDMRGQISKTDNYPYKCMLKERKAAIMGLKEKVKQCQNEIEPPIAV